MSRINSRLHTGPLQSVVYNSSDAKLGQTVIKVLNTNRKNAQKTSKQDTKLSLKWADRTAYVQRPASAFRSRGESDFLERDNYSSIHAMLTLLSNATVSARILVFGARGWWLQADTCTLCWKLWPNRWRQRHGWLL